MIRHLRHPRAYLRSRPRALQRRVARYFGDPAALERREADFSARLRELTAADARDAMAVGAGTPRLSVAPVRGRVTSGFGARFDRMHFGADFAVPEGTPIRAASDGVAVLVETLPEYGTTTVLSHGGAVTTVYAHQQRADVTVGARVRAGDVIGLVGSTGRATGPHLHFEVRADGSPCDPVPLLPGHTSVSRAAAAASTVVRPREHATGTASVLRDELLATFRPLLAGVQRAVLVGFPTHVNAGDSLIWLGEIELLRELGTSIHAIVPTEHRDDRFYRELPADVAILMTGGGTFGDLWTGSQLARERTLRAAVGHRVVQFPQSLCFRDEANIESARAALAAHDDIVLTWRDDESYRAALDLFPTATSVLAPDVAFAGSSLHRTRAPEVPIVLVARTDQEGGELAAVRIPDGERRGWGSEALVDRAVRQATRTVLRLERSVGPVVGRGMRHRLCHASASALVRAAADVVSSAHVVVSDRLHAHVLCAMLGVPHVMVDTRYGKVSAFLRTWMADEELVTLADSPRDAIDRARAINSCTE